MKKTIKIIFYTLVLCVILCLMFFFLLLSPYEADYNPTGDLIDGDKMEVLFFYGYGFC